MEDHKQSKAVIYCRVSTKEQAEEGNSLATQERNCREYAVKYDYDIAQVFIEEGESAKTSERTELQKLLRFCSDRKQHIKAVIIYKIDRLSRNTDDYSQLRLLLKRYGVEIKSTSEYFENTPAGRFMENIIANVAQFDNDVRTERSVGGMKDAVRQGRYVWMAPVGYKNQKVNGKANIAPNDKAGLVKKAFQMVADKIDSTDISRSKLALMGLPVSRSQFYKMLNNKLYAGWITKFGETHKGSFESIVSEELFERVQQTMRIKKTPLFYVCDNPDFPLRRFVYHPDQYKLTGSWSKGRHKRYAYYRFIQAGLQWPKIDLERAFCSFMDEYAFDDKLLKKVKQELSARFSTRSEEKVKYLESLTSAKQHLKEKQSTLLQKNLTGVINDLLLKEQLAILDKEIWDIDKQLLQKEEKSVDVKAILEFINEFFLHPSVVWQKMPFNIQIKLQWFQFPEGVTFDGNRFRTTKISNLFKLKETFSADLSPNVDYPGLNFKHEYLANSPPLRKQKAIAWDEILQELKLLEVLIKTKDKIPDTFEAFERTFIASSPE